MKQGAAGLPVVAPNGALARVFLSFLATAGLFYVNIMPAIIDGIIASLGFSTEQAGFVGSANVYGAAIGALAIVFLVPRVRWRPAAYALLVCLVGMDTLSMLATAPAVMIGARFVHGLAGGALVGVAFSVIARTVAPDRTFGVLLVVQFGLGGLGNLYLPRLVPRFGEDVLFLSLIAFSVVTLAMLPFLDRYPTAAPNRTDAAGPGGRGGAVLPIALVFLAIFLFQAANMGLFAFIIGLGREAGLTLELITFVLAVSAWVGILGALVVIVLYTRYGRALPLSVAMALTIAGFLALHHAEVQGLFLAANCATGITWAFVIAYLLGLAAEFDRTGQMAALGGFASKMGLASGPLAAGMLLGDGGRYALLINLGAVALVLSLLACLPPAIRQDRRAKAPPLAAEAPGS